MSPDALPAITHLQFLVLGMLLAEPRSGRDIRRALVGHGVNRTAPAFYQMMARLEDASFVEGWYDQKVIEGQLIKERHYRVRPAGRRAWNATRDFYLSTLRGLVAAPEPARG
jgi:DNA-binding PadR family transcriptional regulator